MSKYIEKISETKKGTLHFYILINVRILKHAFDISKYNQPAIKNYTKNIEKFTIQQMNCYTTSYLLRFNQFYKSKTINSEIWNITWKYLNISLKVSKSYITIAGQQIDSWKFCYELDKWFVAVSRSNLLHLISILLYCSSSYSISQG